LAKKWDATNCVCAFEKFFWTQHLVFQVESRQNVGQLIVEMSTLVGYSGFAADGDEKQQACPQGSHPPVSARGLRSGEIP
jgi:hypothetical protein